MWESRAVIHFVEEGRRGREQRIEDASCWVVNGLQVSHAAVVIDRHISDVARRAPGTIENFPAVIDRRARLPMSRLEIVRQVKLEMIHNGGIDLVSIFGIGRR